MLPKRVDWIQQNWRDCPANIADSERRPCGVIDTKLTVSERKIRRRLPEALAQGLKPARTVGFGKPVSSLSPPKPPEYGGGDALTQAGRLPFGAPVHPPALLIPEP